MFCAEFCMSVHIYIYIGRGTIIVISFVGDCDLVTNDQKFLEARFLDGA